jgi:hypothetical protein
MLLFAQQPQTTARDSTQSRNRKGADAQSFVTLCLEEKQVPCSSPSGALDLVVRYQEGAT